MGEVLHAIAVFFEQLASVEFVPLLLAVGCHLLKTVCTSRAWRNTIAAAYPEEPVPWRTVYGAYIAAVGVNAVVPIRGGDAVKLYLTHRAIQGASYMTLAATLLVLAIFDTVAALLLFVWALTQGALPGLSLLPSLPGFDFGFVAANPELSIVVFGRAPGARDLRRHLAALPVGGLQAARPAGCRRPRRPPPLPEDRRSVAGGRLDAPLRHDLVLPRRVRDRAERAERARSSR